MKKDKILKLFFIIIISLILFCNTGLISFATNEKTKLTNQKEDIESKIKEIEKEQKDVKKEKSSTIKEIDSLNSKITNYEEQIADLDGQTEELEKSIKEAQVNIKKAEEKYNEQKTALENRLVAIYEAGETSFLDVLLASKNLSDLISKYYLLSEITSYDTELLENIESQRKEIETAKEALESSKTKVEQVKSEKEKTNSALKSSIVVKEKKVKELSEDEKVLQQELEQFEKDRKSINNDLREIAKKEAEKNGGYNSNVAPSSFGYIRPVSGYSITTGLYYSDGSYHGAVDYGGAGINGKPILAVKDGTVVTSTALKNSDGSYRSYGEHIVINHHDGTMTLYAHGQPGSRKVSVGQTVKQGQAIMNVGSTGKSTGPHLHFEVRVITSNGSIKLVNPIPYLP